MANAFPVGKLIFVTLRFTKRVRPLPEGLVIGFAVETPSRELLRVMHFRSRSRLDFLELRKRTQTGCFWLAGAAHARNGEKREKGSDERDEDTDHRNGIRRF